MISEQIPLKTKINMIIILSAFILIVSFFLLRKRKIKFKETDETVDEIYGSVKIPVEETEKIQEKVQETVQETIEEMTKRLEKISSADKDKPFAKISKPSISEVPTEFPGLSDENENEIAESENKRRYKE